MQSVRGLDFNYEGTNIAMFDYHGVLVVSNVQTTNSILHTYIITSYHEYAENTSNLVCFIIIYGLIINQQFIVNANGILEEAH